MLKEIINMDNLSLENCNDARTLFLYLYYNNGNNLNVVSNKILNTGNLKYIHFLLRTFEIKNYNKFIDYILKATNSPRDLFNILYDVDYLNDEIRVKLINRIFEFNNNYYIVKSVYYYFNILQKYNEGIFNKIKLLVKNSLNIEFNKNNSLEVLENLLYKEDYEFNYDGFSNNCFKGRHNHIPNLIVCHISNTYATTIKHFYDENSEVSAHYVIRKDGYIKQVISLADSAWANGTSLEEASDVYYGFANSSIIRNVKDNANYYTFSIEHESFDGSLTDAQLKSSVKVMKEIIKYLKDEYNYDFIIDREHIIGHDEVNPIVRTKCPGNRFPYNKIINELMM